MDGRSTDKIFQLEFFCGCTRYWISNVGFFKYLFKWKWCNYICLFALITDNVSKQRRKCWSVFVWAIHKRDEWRIPSKKNFWALSHFQNKNFTFFTSQHSDDGKEDEENEEESTKKLAKIISFVIERRPTDDWSQHSRSTRFNKLEFKMIFSFYSLHCKILANFCTSLLSFFVRICFLFHFFLLNFMFSSFNFWRCCCFCFANICLFSQSRSRRHRCRRRLSWSVVGVYEYISMFFSFCSKFCRGWSQLFCVVGLLDCR